jgi:hypothetical protein
MSAGKLSGADRALILRELREKVYDPKREAWKKKALSFTINVAKRKLKSDLGNTAAFKGLPKLVDAGYVKVAKSYRLMVEGLSSDDWRNGYWLGESKIHVPVRSDRVSYQGAATIMVVRSDPEYLEAKALAGEEIKLLEDWNRILSEAKGILQAATTINRLKEIWPELETILPGVIKKHFDAPVIKTKALVVSSGRVTGMIQAYRSAQ